MIIIKLMCFFVMVDRDATTTCKKCNCMLSVYLELSQCQNAALVSNTEPSTITQVCNERCSNECP